MKTSEKSRIRNRAFTSNLRSSIRDLRAETNKEEAQKKYREVASLLDQAARKNLIHSRNADRNKSRLAQHIQKLG